MRGVFHVTLEMEQPLPHGVSPWTHCSWQLSGSIINQGSADDKTREFHTQTELYILHRDGFVISNPRMEARSM